MKELSIEIEINENGELSAETFGFKGPLCEQELKKLLENEFVIEEFDKKDDYYKAKEDASVVSKIKGGIL